ncbi:MULTISPECIES: radical SAM/SPASM domain-containing protein [Cyanophyceae]|uniref:radical SAM/SPASM domain-containing protein n=1 Tax=Cyanophyceae TaxID=3028117 RepID=UPI001356585E|nr:MULTISPECIES: radical SAM/SPASM domain-containing protein [Cyanophyceae]
MEWSLYADLIGQLTEVDYDGWLAFHNYNEPLANPRLKQEISFAKGSLPSVKLAIYTNGDLFNEKIYEYLCSIEVSEIRITRYPNSHDLQQPEKHDLNQLWEWLEKKDFLKNLDWKYVAARQGDTLECYFPVKIRIIAPNVNNYYDRGGIISHLSAKKRSKPCKLTSHSLSVDYLGNVKMCCNILSSNPEHSPYIIGNVYKDRLLAIWNNDFFQKVREFHMSCNWSETTICESCIQDI